MCVADLIVKISMCRCSCDTILLIILHLSTGWSGFKVQTTLVIHICIRVHDKNRNTVSLGVFFSFFVCVFFCFFFFFFLFFFFFFFFFTISDLVI